MVDQIVPATFSQDVLLLVRKHHHINIISCVSIMLEWIMLPLSIARPRRGGH
jgi:hypothetical protein